MLGKIYFLAPVLMVGLFPGWTLGQNRVLEFRTRFAQEADAVRRAQKMIQLGESELDEIGRNIDVGKLPQALAVLKEYRDEVQSCAKALDAKNVNVAKHPKGYKQLEISLRQSLRRLNDMIVSLTNDERAAFVDVRNDLEELDSHLIYELFPN